METVETYLRRAAIKYTKQNGVNGVEYKIPCPESGCPSDGKLKASINAASWQWQCFVCSARGGQHSLLQAHGNIYDLQARGSTKNAEDLAVEQFNEAITNRARPANDLERWHEDLLRHKEAMAYLEGRGLSKDTIKQARLGWVANPHSDNGSEPVLSRRSKSASDGEPAKGYVTIPFFTSFVTDEGPGSLGVPAPDTSTCALVKCRALDKQVQPKYVRMKGGKTLLYTPCGINPALPLVIVGGEIDALSVVELGWSNVVSGSGGESTWQDVWTRQLEHCQDIVVIYDNDEPGQVGAQKVVAKLGKHRCRTACWPSSCKDANDALVSRLLTPESMEALIRSAEAPSPAGVSHLSANRARFLATLHDSKAMMGRHTGLPELDDLLGGWREGEVTLVTGDTGCGKSTLASQLALFFAGGLGNKEGEGVLFCPFELGLNRQTWVWMRQMLGDEPSASQAAKVEAHLDLLEAMPVWTFWHRGALAVEPFRQTLFYASNRLNIRFVVIDHLHFVVDEGPNERMQLDALMKMLAEVATETGLHILVVAHPSKVSSASGVSDRDNVIIQAADLKGSSGLKQVADNILSVWRPRRKDRADVVGDDGLGSAALYVLKCRSPFGNEGAVSLKFFAKASTFLPSLGPVVKAQSKPDTKPKPDKHHGQKHWSDGDDDW